MAFPSTAFRGDLNSYVLEAAQADQMLIGLRVAPVAPVTLPIGQFPKFTTAASYLQSDLAGARADGTSYDRATRKFEQGVYNCQEYGLEEPVGDKYRAEFARFFDAEVLAAKLSGHNLRLGHEARVAAQTMSVANFSATAAVVAYTQANLATADFARDLQGAIERLNSSGVVPNAVVMSDTLLNYISRTTLFQNFVKPYNAGVTVLSQGNINRALAEAFGLENLLVGRVARNTSKTATANMAKVWGTTYLWVGRLGDGLPEAGGALRTFAWTGDGGVFVTESYREDYIRSSIVRVRNNVDEKVVDTTAGQLITTSYA